MNYTFQNISTAPSYDALKRNNFSDIDILAYYGTPISERGIMFKQIKAKTELFFKIMPTPTPEPIYVITEKVGTQMCTVNGLLPMIDEMMSKDFIYKGTSYNMLDLGWEFVWIDTKNAFGRCSRRMKVNRITGERTIIFKRIQLSTWLVNNSKATYADWVDTMLHEIAHAIDIEIRNKTDHSEKWKSVARAIGCNAERTTDVEISSKNTKYTIVCARGHETAGHKFSRAIERGGRACTKCCKEFNGGKFSYDYLVTQTQNY